MQEFFKQYHEFEKLGRVMAELAYLKMAERLVSFQTKSLKLRYEELISGNPQLFHQVPQKYIASYLGVTEQSLSRDKTIERARNASGESGSDKPSACVTTEWAV